MKFFVCLVSIYLLSSMAFAQDLTEQKEKPKHIGLTYFSHLLADPGNMVNFSGYMELVRNPVGAILTIYKEGPRLSIGGPKAPPKVAAILDLVRVQGQDHVYNIFNISKSTDHFSQEIIFESKGTLDLTDAYAPATTDTHVLARFKLKYTAPNGQERKIGFFIPFESCQKLKDLGGAN